MCWRAAARRSRRNCGIVSTRFLIFIRRFEVLRVVRCLWFVERRGNEERATKNVSVCPKMGHELHREPRKVSLPALSHERIERGLRWECDRDVLCGPLVGWLAYWSTWVRLRRRRRCLG